MKFNAILLNVLLNFALIYAKSSKNNAKAFTPDTKPFCEVSKFTKNKLYYASIPTNLIKDKKRCNDYVVAMTADPKSAGKYKLVKTHIRDECKECGKHDVRLSIKALKDISGKRDTNVFWAIVSKEGKIIEGPFKPTLSKEETKKLLKASGEKDISEIVKKFSKKASSMVKEHEVHEKEFPWDEKKSSDKKIQKPLPKEPKEDQKKTPKKAPKKEKEDQKKTTKESPKETTKKTPKEDPKKAPKKEKKVKTIKKVKKVTKKVHAKPKVKDTKPKAKDTKPVKNEKTNKATPKTESSSNKNVLTGTVAISVAAGATLLLVRRRSAKKNYIFGEPIDKYDGKTVKELYAKTKSGQKLKIEIPYNDFSDIAHIQIFTPKKETMPNIDVYNVHTEREFVSQDNESIAIPLPQEQPQPHAQLPIPSDDFMMVFSPVEQPDLAAIFKENIGNYDSTKLTTRMIDDPYLSYYEADDAEQEIYNSVPKQMNHYTDDILGDYAEEEEY